MTLGMICPLEVGIGVQDLARMRHFYEQTLGFTFVSEFEVPAALSARAAISEAGYTVVRLQTNSGERIKLLASARAQDAVPAPAYILDKANAVYLTFIVEDIQAVIDNLVAADVELLTGRDRVEVRPGTYLAFCRDPEGNVLEIVQYANIADYRPDIHSTRNP